MLTGSFHVREKPGGTVNGGRRALLYHRGRRAAAWPLAVAMAAGLAFGPGAGPVRGGGAASLQLSPAQGSAGDRVQMTAAGLAPGAQVTFIWGTAVGSYRTKAGPDTIVFYGFKYDSARAVLSRAVADAQGRVSASFAVPDDTGGDHQIAATVDGREAAVAHFKIVLSASLSPARGPVGTPIVVTIHGMGPPPWNTEALSYDNHFTGFISAVTTHGVATARIRAAGPVGPHVVEVNTASNATPYLDAQEGPGFLIRHLDLHRFWTFTVTADTALPANQVEWPAPGAVGPLPPASGQASMALSPAAGPILSRVAVTVKGLTPRTQTQVVWATAGPGNRMTGMTPPQNRSLLAAAAGADGNLSGSFTVPADLGGRHRIEVIQNGAVAGTAWFAVTPSLVAVTPSRLRAGEHFTIQIKGVGWTEIDNGVAVTYDNAYAGYACGFNSRGDVTIPLIATGGPGVHVIDLYPMIYQGSGQPPWTYQVPQLTALEDGPGLALGLRLPIFRLAIVVTP
jgi:hypothetical protein